MSKRLNIFYSMLMTIILVLVCCRGDCRAAASSSKPKLIEKRYNLARARYNTLKFSKKLAKDRHLWLQSAKAFNRAYKTDPYHAIAPRSLLTLAQLYYRVYKGFGKPEDLSESLAYYDDVVTLFPRHRFADDALYKTAKIYATDLKDYKNAGLVFARLLAVYPGGDMVKRAAVDLRKLKLSRKKAKPRKPTISRATQKIRKKTEPPGKRNAPNKPQTANVMAIRHWSTKDYTRVVIETSTPVEYNGHLLKKDGKKPRRLYVNLTKCRINKMQRKALPVKDGLLHRIRSAQFKPETVRVVLDTLTLSDYKIFNLDNPFRIVIDVKGTKQVKKAPPSKIVSLPNAPSLAQQLGLGIKRIVIDPGHGGKDPGAIGVNGIKEKDIVLKVAKKVARKITKELGIEVVLTRKRDVFIPLEERTAIANTKDGDLFISIHANAAKSSKARGLETYYLDFAVSKEDMRIAAKENATSAQKISDLQKILSSLMKNSKKDESAKLAGIVQNSLVNGLSLDYKDIRDHGVKKAPFIVLIGAQMPSILTEIAFISNPIEAKRIQRDEYLEAIADHISGGIVKYAMVLNMASL